MTQEESVRTLVRIMNAAEARVKADGGTAEDFRKFLHGSPNFVPQVIAAAIEDTRKEIIAAVQERMGALRSQEAMSLNQHNV